MQHHLDRIARHGDAVGAFVTVTMESALAQAEAAQSQAKEKQEKAAADAKAAQAKAKAKAEESAAKEKAKKRRAACTEYTKKWHAKCKAARAADPALREAYLEQRRIKDRVNYHRRKANQ